MRISREGQVTERFTRAVDQLGREHLDIRLGALYALERIARDSLGDRRTIAEVLTAYIRHRAPWPPTQPSQHLLEQQPDLRIRAPDVQAAFTVLGRGPFAKPTARVSSQDRLDLRDVDLRKAQLDYAHLERADLSYAHLEEARLFGVHLERAFLFRAYLDRAWLLGAHLEGAQLKLAHLEGAWLDDADLQGANLDEAHLGGAQIMDARLDEASLTGAYLQEVALVGSSLRGTWLEDANLEGARLAGANLERARLAGANLEGAELIGAHLGVADANLKGALATAKTCWPDGFDWRAAGVVMVNERGEPA